VSDTKDELDLELEADLEPAAAPVKAPEVEARKPAKAAPARKPGPLLRLWNSFNDWLVSISRLSGDWKTFGWVLLVLVALAILVENWAPVRVSIFGARFELPKSLGFLLNILIGAALSWFWVKRLARPAEGDK
jgi:uncharacterized integral membrane protein